MTLEELELIGLNAEDPDVHAMEPRALQFYERGKKAATDHIIAALLRDRAAQLQDGQK